MNIIISDGYQIQLAHRHHPEEDVLVVVEGRASHRDSRRIVERVADREEAMTDGRSPSPERHEQCAQICTVWGSDYRQAQADC